MPAHNKHTDALAKCDTLLNKYNNNRGRASISFCKTNSTSSVWHESPFRLPLNDVLEDDDCDCKPEDLFGWYVIVLKCKECGTVNQIADFECA
jgi:hypothetical protein